MGGNEGGPCEGVFSHRTVKLSYRKSSGIGALAVRQTAEQSSLTLILTLVCAKTPCANASPEIRVPELPHRGTWNIILSGVACVKNRSHYWEVTRPTPTM